MADSEGYLVFACRNGKVLTVAFCQVVIVGATVSATPRDSPVVVDTELDAAAADSAGPLPVACCGIVGHVVVCVPVVAIADNTDCVNLCEFVGKGNEVDIDTIEACTRVRNVRATVDISNLAFAVVLVVAFPVVSIWLELEITVQIVVTYVLAIVVGSIESVGRCPSAFVSNLIEELVKLSAT